jgi:hypothetical protein
MNIETIIKHERLPALLNKTEGQSATDDLVTRWWSLAQAESRISAEIAEAEVRMVAMRQRLDRIMGGREIVETMIVEADERVRDLAERIRSAGPGLSLVEPAGPHEEHGA